MKKTIMALALVMAVAFTANNSMAWGWGNGWHGNGMMGYGNTYGASAQVYQDFLKDTAKLRADIAADRAELAAVMANPSPDPKRVRTLTEQLTAKSAKLNEKAAAANLPQTGNGGYGMMGHGMMGSGMMNGYYNCW